MSGSDSGGQRFSGVLPPVQQILNSTLANGTSTILTYSIPADGKQHLFYVASMVNVTVAETGGQVTLNYTQGGSAQTAVLDAGGHGLGQFPGSAVVLCDNGTTIQVRQATALTAGTAALSAAISGG